jgi:predicted RNA-binding Zn ribbon-like protein
MASERYKVRQAPGGLALVQDLVNTKGIRPYAVDLLASPDSASAWQADAAEAWAATRGVDAPDGVTEVTGDDLPRLRELRSTIDALLPAGTGARHPVDAIPGTQVRLAPGPDGQVSIVPVGDGAAWTASAVWSEVMLAQLDGSWARLKLCRNVDCASAFYDASRNNSGVWHSVRTCGNAANLRASRARKRERETPNG